MIECVVKPFTELSFLSQNSTSQPFLFCVCVMCTGSNRIIDTEFDDGLMVVSKGGWGAWSLST